MAIELQLENTRGVEEVDWFGIDFDGPKFRRSKPIRSAITALVDVARSQCEPSICRLRFADLLDFVQQFQAVPMRYRSLMTDWFD